MASCLLRVEQPRSPHVPTAVCSVYVHGAKSTRSESLKPRGRESALHALLSGILITVIRKVTSTNVELSLYLNMTIVYQKLSIMGDSCLCAELHPQGSSMSFLLYFFLIGCLLPCRFVKTLCASLCFCVWC